MTILITGAAGFIGYHTSLDLMSKGHKVIGVDNLNEYYDLDLKHARLSQLKDHENFTFIKADISNKDAIFDSLEPHKDNIEYIINLAAQAGVRYSLEQPLEYGYTNLVGHLVMLEVARHFPNVKHFVYASSSSVYGGNTQQPYSIDQKAVDPVSLYAATKGANELMTQSYAHMYGISATGLRFFTVYGPWGRPDMAYFIFAKNITEGKPITVFNHGDMHRDFTWIDDCVNGIVAATLKPPAAGDAHCIGEAPHRVFNFGHNKRERLLDFIEEIEKALGIEATKNFADMVKGDVKETYANIDASKEVLGYNPKTPIHVGIPKFVEWYKEFYKV